MRCRSCVGYPSALTAKTWGFYDVAFKGKPFEFERPFGSYVMENVLFKISFPAEFHAQTAVECAMQLHPQVKDRHRPDRADRDRDPGSRRPHHRQDRPAGQLRRPRPLPAVHGRRAADLRPPDRRRLRRRRRRRSAHRRAAREDGGQGEPAVHRATTSIPTSATSATRCRCSSRTARSTEKVSIDYPIGHRKRRAEGIPVLMAKFEAAMRAQLPAGQADQIMALAADRPSWKRCRSRVHDPVSRVRFRAGDGRWQLIAIVMVALTRPSHGGINLRGMACGSAV